MAQRLAWYCAQTAARQFAAEAIVGKILDFRAVINDDSRGGYSTTQNWLFSGGQYLHPLIQGSQSGKRRIWWSAPPFWQGGNWDAAANGDYDNDWRMMMQGIIGVEAANGNSNGIIEFRPAFEFNGAWFHWSVGTKVNQFITAWRRMWNVANNLAPGRFLFEYAPSETSQFTGAYSDPNACWPGNQYVQKCGLDVYWKPFASWGQWGTEPNAAFNSALTSPLGLNWLKNFAAAKGNKPIVLSEWGVQGGVNFSNETINTEPYVRKTAEWCRANNCSMLYWNGTLTEGFPGDIISHNNWPVTRAAIINNFVAYADNSLTTGGGTVPTPTPTEPNPTPAPPVNSAAGALSQFNGETYGKRGAYPEPGNGYIRTWESLSYWPLVALGLKTDVVPAGEETDPEAAATEIHTDMVAKRGSFTGAALTQVDAWIALLAPWIETAPPVEPEPEPEPEPLPAVLWESTRTHPEDALAWITQSAYSLRNSTSLSTVLAVVRQIEATAYWSSVAAGWRTDPLYTGSLYAVGDVSQAQALLDEAVAQRNTAVTNMQTAQAALTAAQTQVTTLTNALTALQGSTDAEIAAAEAAVAAAQASLTVAQANYSAASAQVVSLTEDLAVAQARVASLQAQLDAAGGGDGTTPPVTPTDPTPVPPTPSIAAPVVSVATLARRTLQRLGVLMAPTAEPEGVMTLADMAAAALRQAGGPAIAQGSIAGQGGTIDITTLNDRVLQRLGVVATEEAPATTDANAASEKLRRVHSLLVGQNLASWLLTAIPDYAAESYVIMASELLAPVYGKPTNFDAYSAAEGKLATMALRRASGQSIGEEKIRSVHATIAGLGLAEYALSATPRSMAQAYIDAAAAVLAPLYGGQINPAAMADAERRARLLALGRTPGMALAEEAVLSAHRQLAAEGIARWMLQDVPAYAEEPYAMISSIILGPRAQIPVDPTLGEIARRDLLRIVGIRSAGAAIRQEYF